MNDDFVSEKPCKGAIYTRDYFWAELELSAECCLYLTILGWKHTALALA